MNQKSSLRKILQFVSQVLTANKLHSRFSFRKFEMVVAGDADGAPGGLQFYACQVHSHDKYECGLRA